MRREALTRFGKYRFGYVLAFIEPAIYIFGFGYIRSLLAEYPVFGSNTLLFLVTGLLIVRSVIIIGGRMMGSITANTALLTYPAVKTFDVIVGRGALEIITLATVATVFVLGMYILMDVWMLNDIETIVTGYIATIFLAFSIGAFNAVFSRIFPLWERVWSLSTLMLLIGSGVFYLPSSLPPDLLNILWYNPILHVVEWVRLGVYIGYNPIFNINYVLSVSTVLLFIALFLNRFYQRFLISR